MIRIHNAFTTVSFLFIAGLNSHAQWSTNTAVNNAICTATNNQEAPNIISDGSGGAIITWQDLRNGFPDYGIYAQRINSSGVVQWAVDGVPICSATNDQRYPTITSDGNGGAIITWQDLRNGTDLDIYAQRINSSGAVQWTANGVLISAAADDQEDPMIASDGSSGAIITWQELRNAANYDIYSQRINSAGVVQWTANGVSVCSAADMQYSPALIPDGSGGAFISWYDFRSGNDFDVYAQRMNSSGVAQWVADGTVICNATNYQEVPALVSDGAGGAIITWRDGRNGSYFDIYAQRVNSAGTIQWVSNGVAISNAAFDQLTTSIASDGSGGAVITWEDKRSFTEKDIYAQRINSSGTVQWTTDGEVICTAANDQDDPIIISDGSGNVYITWSDSRSGVSGYDIYVQQVNTAGVMQWTANGIIISNAAFGQGSPKIIFDGGSSGIITWQDGRPSPNNDIYVQRIADLFSGISTVSSEFFMNMFPVPSSGQITLQSSVNVSKISILNLLGETVYTTSVNSNTALLNLHHLPAGTYFYTAYSDENSLSTGKLLLTE
ncbi:MAG: T9SS type A sorting domain-containing protein [Flavobacteriales bacterium]